MADSPLHIAIIADGNRRWATKKGLRPWEGHRHAIEHFRDLSEWCRNDPRVSVLTVWCFSTENWKRDKKETEMLMKLFEEYIRKEGEKFLQEHTRFVHSGRKDRIPESLAAAITKLEEQTKDETAFTLNLAIDYGGMDEVARAALRCQSANLPISQSALREHLDHPELPDIDLIIRTSGEKRTSNFSLWQGAYAEWDFVEKYFPDFTADDLAASVERFAERSRRFGA